MTGKTGTSMNIEVNKKMLERLEKKKLIQYKKSSARNSRAKICIECEYNNEGYCSKHKAWCGRVNYICLGIKDPYEYKMPKSKTPVKKKKKKKKHKTKLGV